MHPLFSCAGECAYETIRCFSKTASVVRDFANGRFSLFAADAAGAWYSQRLIGKLRQRLMRCPLLTQRWGNRPVWVKHFQTIHHCSVDVARRLVLLFGIGTRALPLWDSKTRRNNLLGGLTGGLTAGPSGQTNSPHPSSREEHLSTAGWSSRFLLSDLIFHGCHAAAAACSRVQRNSVPSTQMRCMITANRRASATIAFFFPRRLAICIAQALSQDHLFECNRA